jgi:hypothetical protein
MFLDPTIYADRTGQFLLDWYWTLEDHCCLILCRRPPLPISWREKALRIRRKTAVMDCPSLSQEAWRVRRLDDLWQELTAANPLLAEAITIVLSLQTLEPNSRKPRLADLERLLTSIWNKLSTIRESRETRDLFETHEVSLTS